MAEATDATSPNRPLTPDRVVAPLVRQRLSPLVWKRFVPPESQPTSPTHLPEREVQNKCFAILGYLEEYYLPSSAEIAKVKAVDVSDEGTPRNERGIPNKNSGLEQLEQQADAVLQGELNKEAESVQTGQRQEQLAQRLAELLATPEVRDRFEQEFNKELPLYQAARRPMREVRDLDRVTRKLKKAINKRYLTDKQQYGKLVQSSVDQIHFFKGKLRELEQQREGIEAAASPATLGYLETQKLLDYKRQMQEKGFVVTPSREHLIDRITDEALAGKKIFLVGSTGTGKTQLAFYALNNLTGGYELINWHEGTTPRDLFGYRELWTDELGGVQSGMKPGPVPKALERGVGVIHEEYTGGSTRTQLAAKFMMGARPGDKIQIPGFNGQIFDVTNNFVEIFTGNPRDERTKQREDMDPAILRELTGVEVSYMSAPEMNDIIRATLIQESGVLKISRSEAEYVERLTKAAEMMQRIHNRDFEGFSTEMRTTLGIDAQGNTDTTLNSNFLDPGTLFKLFYNWDKNSAEGQSFESYMGDKLREFITDPKTLSTPEERKALQKILHVFGLITSESGDIQVSILHQDKGYILPSQMAGEITQSNENPMGNTSTSEGNREATTEIQMTEQRAWQDILGNRVDIAPVPDYITPEVIRKLEAFGMELKYIPALDLKQTDLQNQDIETYLQGLATQYPNWKPYESLSPTDKNNHDVVRNIRKWFWEQVKDGRIDFPILPGRWAAVEIMDKPNQGIKYPDSPLTSRMNLDDRVNVSWNNGKTAINTIKGDFIRDIGVATDKTNVRYPTGIEWNLLANRQGWGKTNLYEWAEDEYRRPDGYSARVVIGDSDGGGAAYASWDTPAGSGPIIGFRLVVIFEP